MTPEILGKQISFLWPELILALGAMFVVVTGAYTKASASRFLTWASVAVLLFGAIAAVCVMPNVPTVIFSGSFVADQFSAFAKLIMAVLGAAALALSLDYLEDRQINRAEYPVLTILSVLGMFVMVSAKDLMALYMGVELQSLALYVLAAYARDDAKSSEAGLKYFVLGALSSGLLLYGCSLIYGFTGSVEFTEIAKSPAIHNGSVGLIFGMVFVLCGLGFKMSAAPFHMWTPDVYEGAPTASTAFFASAPKMAAAVLIARFCYDAFGPALEDWRQIIGIMAVLSMLVGAIFALQQTNIKRLLAYSSIANMGYALVGIAAGPVAGPKALLVFVSLYALTSLGLFGVALNLRRADGQYLEKISDLSGLSTRRPGLAVAMSILVFSVMGIPPLAGFFGKFEIFQAAVAGKVVPLALVLVISSVISAFYYLRMMKTVWFDAPSEAVLEQQYGGSATLTGVVWMLALLTPMIALLAGAAQIAGLSVR